MATKRDKKFEQAIEKAFKRFGHVFSARPLFWGIIILTLVVVLMDWPTIPVKLELFGKKVDVVLRGPDFEDIPNGKIAKKLDLKLGLDLQGGTYIALKGNMDGIDSAERIDKINSTKEVLKKRVDQFGLSESSIFTSVVGDEYRIIVELPGAGDDVEKQIDVLKSTAKLEFWSKKSEAEVAADNIMTYLDENGQFKEGLSIMDYYLNPSDVSGADLKTARSQASTSTGTGYEILLEFTDEGAIKFNNLAIANRGNSIAIVLDDQIISQPTVNADFGLTGGESKFVQITGDFSKEEASDLAIQLRGGALPIPVEIVEQKTIEPALGQEALNKSIIGGIVGIVLLMTFMIFQYKRNGIIADVALSIYILINLAVYKFIPITLSLAGIAGFILSIGVAVDGNILIFERMLEEVRKGKTVLNATKISFMKAWPSIRDSNFSSLLTCVMLFSFGSTSVKAFAINLGIGLLLGLLTAVTVTRTFMAVFTSEKSK